MLYFTLLSVRLSNTFVLKILLKLGQSELEGSFR